MATGSQRYPNHDITLSDSYGSHMPLDTTIYWDWRNPLNAIPGLFLLLVIVAVVALI